MTELTLKVSLDHAAYCNGCDFLWESTDNIECLRTNSKLEYDQRDITRPPDCPLQPVTVAIKCATCIHDNTGNIDCTGCNMPEMKYWEKKE